MPEYPTTDTDWLATAQRLQLITPASHGQHHWLPLGQDFARRLHHCWCIASDQPLSDLPQLQPLPRHTPWTHSHHQYLSLTIPNHPHTPITTTARQSLAACGLTTTQLHLPISHPRLPHAPIADLPADLPHLHLGTTTGLTLCRLAIAPDNQPIVAITPTGAHLYGGLIGLLSALLHARRADLPFHLVPMQTAILPVTPDQLPQAQQLDDQLSPHLRTTLIPPRGTLQGRLRDAILAGAATLVVIGSREAAAGTLTIRSRTSRQLHQTTPAEALQTIASLTATTQSTR